MPKSLQDADREARKLVTNWTTGAALTGWIPGSAFFLTAADTAMIHQVSSAYEVNAFEMDHLLSTLSGAVGSAIAGGVIAEAAGLIPLAGWAVKSAAMAAKAKVIGDAVIRYFRERSDLPDMRVPIPVETGD
ncbi:MAG: hypothetical protein OXE46_10020 [Chloroflexi bacterium]|nr:hypothetical protein [Chloroflexota bacterium]